MCIVYIKCKTLMFSYHWFHSSLFLLAQDTEPQYPPNYNVSLTSVVNVLDYW